VASTPAGEIRPPTPTYEDLARCIDHEILRPESTDAEVAAGCEMAQRYSIATIIVRPCDIDMAARMLAGTAVKPGSVCGFPHGDQNTGTKLYETRDLLRRGAREIDFVINISKLLARQFPYVETELLQASEACHKEGAIFKVILENAYINDEHRVIACRICSRVDADFISTSTGFAASGYSAADVKVLRKHSAEETGIKAAGGMDSLDVVLEAREAGCSRIGTSETVKILDEWKHQIAAMKAVQPADKIS
jgi:deoxyribose-phosphate aldolase